MNLIDPCGAQGIKQVKTFGVQGSPLPCKFLDRKSKKKYSKQFEIFTKGREENREGRGGIWEGY